MLLQCQVTKLNCCSCERSYTSREVDFIRKMYVLIKTKTCFSFLCLIKIKTYAIYSKILKLPQTYTKNDSPCNSNVFVFKKKILVIIFEKYVRQIICIFLDIRFIETRLYFLSLLAKRYFHTWITYVIVYTRMNTCIVSYFSKKNFNSADCYY